MGFFGGFFWGGVRGSGRNKDLFCLAGKVYCDSERECVCGVSVHGGDGRRGGRIRIHMTVKDAHLFRSMLQQPACLSSLSKSPEQNGV